MILPTWRDPRLHLAAVVMSLQVLGQTVLGFELSVAQILLCLLTCAVLETGIALWRQGVVMWPASALLTGNSVAFLLRVPGTRHGDWWSLDGAAIFAGAAAASLLSKHLLRRRGQHLFNPSNLGLVLCFLVVGTQRANPQDLWWGGMSWGLALTLTVIVAGGLSIAGRLAMLGLVAAFAVVFATSVGVVAATGHCMTARWHVGPVCGAQFWSTLVTSPELLVFVLLMITDPRTTPAGRVARIVFGVAVAFAAGVLVAPQQTEFATKVAVLGGLVVVCTVRPLLERRLPAPGSAEDRPLLWLRRRLGGPRRRAGGAAGVAIRTGAAGLAAAAAVGILVAAAAPARLPAAGATALTGVASPADPRLGPNAAALPPVTIAADVRDADPSLDGAAARALVGDVLDDLAVEAEAVRAANASLLAGAATGAWLRACQDEIRSDRTRGVTTVATYHVTSAAVVLVRDPGNPQAAPLLGVEIRGVLHREVRALQQPNHVLHAGDSAYQGVFLPQLVDDRYLIAQESTPPGDA